MRSLQKERIFWSYMVDPMFVSFAQSVPRCVQHSCASPKLPVPPPSFTVTPPNIPALRPTSPSLRPIFLPLRPIFLPLRPTSPSLRPYASLSYKKSRLQLVGDDFLLIRNADDKFCSFLFFAFYFDCSIMKKDELLHD